MRWLDRKGIRLIAVGIRIGILAGYLLARFLSNQIWGVSPVDPLTFLLVSRSVILVGLVACYLPARRAASIDPLVAIRYE